MMMPFEIGVVDGFALDGHFPNNPRRYQRVQVVVNRGARSPRIGAVDRPKDLVRGGMHRTHQVLQYGMALWRAPQSGKPERFGNVGSQIKQFPKLD